MRNGLRQQRVGIYTVQVSQDSTGEYAETGTTLVRTVWAMARKLEAKGQVLSTQSIPDPKWTFEFQYVDSSDLTIQHRLVYDSRSFDVLDVDNVMENRHVIRALCSERR